MGQGVMTTETHSLHDVWSADCAVAEKIHKLRGFSAVGRHVWPHLPQQLHQTALILVRGQREREGGEGEGEREHT